MTKTIITIGLPIILSYFYICVESKPLISLKNQQAKCIQVPNAVYENSILRIDYLAPDVVVLPVDDSQKHTEHVLDRYQHQNGAVLPEGNLERIYQSQHHPGTNMDRGIDQLQKSFRQKARDTDQISRFFSGQETKDDDLTSDLTISIHQYDDDTNTRKQAYNQKRYTILHNNGTLHYHTTHKETNAYKNNNHHPIIQICIQSIHASLEHPSMVGIHVTTDILESIIPSSDKKLKSSKNEPHLFHHDTFQNWKENVEGHFYVDINAIKTSHRNVHFAKKKFQRGWKYHHKQYRKYPVLQIFIILVLGYHQVTYLRDYWNDHMILT